MLTADTAEILLLLRQGGVRRASQASRPDNDFNVRRRLPAVRLWPNRRLPGPIRSVTARAIQPSSLSTIKSEVQVLISLGSLPPLAASFPIICLCNQTFMVAESLVSPVYFNSLASSLRAFRLLSRLSAFIRSTMEVRHASFSPFAAAALSTIAATSTVCAGGTLGAAVGDALACAEP